MDMPVFWGCSVVKRCLVVRGIRGLCISVSYSLLVHYFETLGCLLRNILGGLLLQPGTYVLGEIASLETFHYNIQSLGLLEPSREPQIMTEFEAKIANG